MKRHIEWGVLALLVVVAVGCGKKDENSQPQQQQRATQVNPPNAPAATTPAVDACTQERPILSGRFELHETFDAANGANFRYACWRTTASSRFRNLTEKQGAGDFSNRNSWWVSHSWSGIPARIWSTVNARVLGVQTDPALRTSTGVSYAPYNRPEIMLTSTGQTDNGQWPWQQDVLYDSERCANDVEISVKVKPWNRGTGAVAANTAIFAVGANLSVEGQGAAQKLSGYYVLVNTGGNGAPLLVLNNAPDFFADGIDQHPGHLIPGTPHPQRNPISEFGGTVKLKDWVVSPAMNTLNEKQVTLRVVKTATSAAVTATVKDLVTNATYTRRAVFTGSDFIAKRGGAGYFVTVPGGLTNLGGSLLHTAIHVNDVKLSCQNPRL